MSFQWPPGTPSTQTPADAPATPAATPRITLWRAIERTWLAETRPPLHERLANWRPDEPVAYCPRCATSVGPYEADADGCASCRGRRLAWDAAVRLGAHTAVLRDVIHEIKFQRDRHAASVIGEMLGRALVERLLAAGRNPAQATIIPVPSTMRRRVNRGIDHALCVARAAARVGSMNLDRALTRRHRPSQVSLSWTERRRSVAGTMRVKPGCRVKGLVVVIDDVRTTGATMTEACRRISQAGADDVWSCVIAVSQRRRKHL